MNMTLRLPEALALKLKQRARAEHRSLHGQVVYLLDLQCREMPDSITVVQDEAAGREAASRAATVPANEYARFTAPAIEIHPPRPKPNGRGGVCCCPAAMVKAGKHLKWCTEGK